MGSRQGELRAARVIENSSGPLRRAVADRAILGKSRRYMVGIHAPVVFRKVAGCTLCRRACKNIVCMTEITACI